MWKLTNKGTMKITPKWMTIPIHLGVRAQLRTYHKFSKDFLADADLKTLRGHNVFTTGGCRATRVPLRWDAGVFHWLPCSPCSIPACQVGVGYDFSSDAGRPTYSADSLTQARWCVCTGLCVSHGCQPMQEVTSGRRRKAYAGFPPRNPCEASTATRNIGSKGK